MSRLIFSSICVKTLDKVAEHFWTLLQVQIGHQVGSNFYINVVKLPEVNQKEKDINCKKLIAQTLRM